MFVFARRQGTPPVDSPVRSVYGGDGKRFYGHVDLSTVVTVHGSDGFGGVQTGQSVSYGGIALGTLVRSGFNWGVPAMEPFVTIEPKGSYHFHDITAGRWQDESVPEGQQVGLYRIDTGTGQRADRPFRVGVVTDGTLKERPYPWWSGAGFEAWAIETRSPDDGGSAPTNLLDRDQGCQVWVLDGGEPSHLLGLLAGVVGATGQQHDLGFVFPAARIGLGQPAHAALGMQALDLVGGPGVPAADGPLETRHLSATLPEGDVTVSVSFDLGSLQPASQLNVTITRVPLAGAAGEGKEGQS